MIMVGFFTTAAKIKIKNLRKGTSSNGRNICLSQNSERPRSLLLSLGGAIQTLAWVLSWARPGPIPGPRWSRPDSPCALFYSVSDPSRSRGGGHPGRPGPILLPSVPYRIGPGRAETDFLATSEKWDIAQMCWCETNYQRKVSHHFGGGANLPEKASRDIGCRSDSTGSTKGLMPPSPANS